MPWHTDLNITENVYIYDVLLSTLSDKDGVTESYYEVGSSTRRSWLLLLLSRSHVMADISHKDITETRNCLTSITNVQFWHFFQCSADTAVLLCNHEDGTKGRLSSFKDNVQMHVTYFSTWHLIVIITCPFVYTEGSWTETLWGQAI